MKPLIIYRENREKIERKYCKNGGNCKKRMMFEGTKRKKWKTLHEQGKENMMDDV